MLHTDVNSTPQSGKAFPYMDRSVYANEPFNKHLNTKIQGSLFDLIQANLGFLRAVSIQEFVRNLLSDFFEGNLSYTTPNHAETVGFLQMETSGNLSEIGFLETNLLAAYSNYPGARRFVTAEEFNTLQQEYDTLKQGYEDILGDAADVTQLVVMSLEELQELNLTDEKIEDILEMANMYENAFDLIKEKYGAREPE